MSAPDTASPLSKALGPAVRRQAGLALALVGEAGIGKTHALRAALAVAPCRHLTVAATAPLAAALPAERPPSLTVLLGVVVERIARGEAVAPEAGAAALGRVVRGLAPFVLAFEDVHEADEGRVALLVELARIVRDVRGGALVVTTRHQPPPGFRPIGVDPLARAGASALLEAEVGNPVPEAALDWIHTRAAGNPLFTLAYFRHLARQGHLWSDGRTWRWRAPQEDSMPTTIEALLEEPLRRARGEPGLAAVLDAQALLDPGAADRVIAAVANVPVAALRRAERELGRRGLLRNGAFAHPLIREVALRTLPAERRRELARRAVEVHGAHPAEAARYVGDAGLPDEEAVRILTAGAREMRARDETEAGKMLAAAVPFAPRGLRNGLAHEAAGMLQRVDHAEARRLLAIAIADDPGDREAVLQLAELHALEGHGEQVEALLAHLPSGAQREDDWAERTIKLHFALGRYDDVVRAWLGRPELHAAPSADLAYRVGFALVVMEALPQAESLARVALRAPDLTEVQRARLVTVLGLAASYAGDRVRAAPLLHEAVRLARSAGHLAYLASALHNRATHLEETNDVAGALADTKEALELYARTGSTRHYASTLTKLGRLLHEMGRYEEAEAHLLESRSLHLQGTPSAYLVTCEAQLGQLYLDWRSPHARALAHKHTSAAVAVADRLGNPDKTQQAYTCLALVETWLGRPERAQSLLDELDRQLPGRTDGVYQTIFARGYAVEALGRAAEAEACYHRAMAMAFESDWHAYGHKIGLELDRLRGDTAGAAQRLTWFEEHGLLNGARLARRYFPDTETVAAGPVGAAGPAAGLRLELLGPLRVRIGGHEIALRGHKRRALLAALLDARLAGMAGESRPSLIDALYPGTADDAALVALKQLVSQTRKVLGADAIVATATGYALGPLTSDAEVFLRTLDTRLWRGPYREDLGHGNAAVEGALAHALAMAAGALLERDPHEARRIGLVMLRADPYDERGLRLTLRALRAMDRADEARRAFEEARERFAELGETLPGDWQEYLTTGDPGDAGAEGGITGISPA